MPCETVTIQAQPFDPENVFADACVDVPPQMDSGTTGSATVTLVNQNTQDEAQCDVVVFGPNGMWGERSGLLVGADSSRQVSVQIQAPEVTQDESFALQAEVRNVASTSASVMFSECSLCEESRRGLF